jgi:hypothetical protein
MDQHILDNLHEATKEFAAASKYTGDAATDCNHIAKGLGALTDAVAILCVEVNEIKTLMNKKQGNG